MIGRLQMRAAGLVGTVLMLALGTNTAVLVWVAYDRYEDSVEARLRSEGTSLVRELDKIVGFGMALNEIEGLKAKLAVLAEQDDTMHFVYVTDAKGARVAHTELSPLGDAAEPDSAFSLPLTDAVGENAGHVVMGLSEEVLSLELYRLLGWALLVSIASFAVFVVVVYILVLRFITRPITAMQGVAKEMASGNLHKRVAVNGHDEIADLGAAINDLAVQLLTMMGQLGKLTGGVGRVTGNVSKSCGQLVTLAAGQVSAVEKTVGSVSEMNEAMAEVSHSSGMLQGSSDETSRAVSNWTDSVSEVAAAVAEFHKMSESSMASIDDLMRSIDSVTTGAAFLDDSVEHTVSSVQRVSRAMTDIRSAADASVEVVSDVSSKATHEARDTVTSAMEGMEEIKTSVSALGDVINRLGERSTEIGSILTVVDDVAKQTSLLSLNASILAAQAGREGHAFAVVATEIKNLADRTAISTGRISQVIESVQAETQSSIELAQSGFRVVERGVTLVRDVDEALSNIARGADRAAEMSRQIQASTHDTVAVTTHIATNVGDMRARIRQIAIAAQQQSDRSGAVLNASKKIYNLSADLERNTENQFREGRRLTSISSEVARQATNIRQALAQQQARSDSIVENVNQIRSSADTLGNTAAGLDADAKSLDTDTSYLRTEIRRIESGRST